MIKEIEIIPKIYDFTLYFSKKYTKYPKKYKYTLGERINKHQFDLLEYIIEAKYTTKKKKVLYSANLSLEKLRFMIRISKDLECITTKEYEFISKQINEIGIMIGGWLKGVV